MCYPVGKGSIYGKGRKTLKDKLAGTQKMKKEGKKYNQETKEDDETLSHSLDKETNLLKKDIPNFWHCIALGHSLKASLTFHQGLV